MTHVVRIFAKYQTGELAYHSFEAIAVKLSETVIFLK